jgi:hypothetical protein
MAGWSLQSSSGRERVSFEGRMLTSRLGTVAGSLTITGTFWQRDRNLSSATLTQDFDVVLHQVLVQAEDLVGLHRKLLAWLQTYAEFECELSTSAPGDPRVRLQLGKNDGLICTRDRPALTLTYKGRPAMEGEWAFLVDQSCVRLCAEEMQAFLHENRSE